MKNVNTIRIQRQRLSSNLRHFTIGNFTTTYLTNRTYDLALRKCLEGKVNNAIQNTRVKIRRVTTWTINTQRSSSADERLENRSRYCTRERLNDLSASMSEATSKGQQNKARALMEEK